MLTKAYKILLELLWLAMCLCILYLAYNSSQEYKNRLDRDTLEYTYAVTIEDDSVYIRDNRGTLKTIHRDDSTFSISNFILEDNK